MKEFKKETSDLKLTHKKTRNYEINLHKVIYVREDLTS